MSMLHNTLFQKTHTICCNIAILHQVNENLKRWILLYNNNNNICFYAIILLALSRFSSGFTWPHYLLQSSLSTCFRPDSTRLFVCSLHNFLGQPFSLFPSISSSMTSHMSKLLPWQMTWPCHCKRLCTKMSSILIKNTNPFSDNIIWDSIYQFYPTNWCNMLLHPMQPHSLCNSKFPSFTTV